MFEHVKNALRALRLPSVAERELAYLNQSVSHYDLEMRQRQIEAGMFRR